MAGMGAMTTMTTTTTATAMTTGRAGRGSHAAGQEQRARYIELRQSGLSREAAAVEMGLYGNDRTVYRYEKWLEAVSSGAEIVPGKPGRPRVGTRTVEASRMTRPRLLDLFCGAGGAAMGYHRAGFDVIGVDNRPQPRYPFEFHQADAMDVLNYAPPHEPWLSLGPFDAIHASPPCQDHSPLRSVAGEHGTGWMLDATLDRLADQPAVWVVENVAAAHNRADFLLCGEMFGLRTVRHRRFTVDPRLPGLLAVPPHPRHKRPTSTKNRVSALAEGHNLSITGNVGVHAGPLCMGIDWMTGDELSQAIPPAYTEYIGRQLMEHLAESVTRT